MGYATDGNVLNKQVNQQALLTGNVVSNTQRAGIWIGNVYGATMGDNDVANFGLAGGDLGNSPHLNDGLLPYAHTAFTKAMLAWCVANPRAPCSTLSCPTCAIPTISGRSEPLRTALRSFLPPKSVVAVAKK